MAKLTVRQTRYAVYDTHIHLVFVVNHRREAFTSELLRECEHIMAKVCTDFDAFLEEFSGESDHVHLLVSIPPTVPVSKLVNSLKGVSSRLLRQKDPDRLHQFLWNGHFWSRSYYVGTGTGASLDSLKDYVQSQDRDKCSS